MKLKVLGSGSSGNCYLLDGEDECLVIEAGLPFSEIKKAAGYNLRKIRGVILSHEHGDHSKYASQIIKSGIKIYCGYGTQKALDTIGHELTIPILPRKITQIGGFKVIPFEVPHGDVECYGYLIEHSEMGKLLFLTDLEYCRYNFHSQGINHLLVEANYTEEMIDEYAINREHVLLGHMSLTTAHGVIQTNDNPLLENIVLIHLSGGNADPEEFLERTRKVTDKKIYIARKGLEVDLSLCPF